MKTLRILMAVLALCLAGSNASALEPVPWGQQEFLPQFKFFTEQKAYTPELWEALQPAQQEYELGAAREPALRRKAVVAAYHAAAMAKWDTRRLREFAARTKPEDLKTVKLWQGPAAAAAFEKKLAVTRDLLRKAETEGLKQADAAALAPYLTEQAIAELRALKAAEGLQRQAEAAKKSPAPKSVTTSSLEKAAGSISRSGGGDLSKFFDGNAASGDAAAVRLGDAQAGGRGTSGATNAALASQVRTAAGTQTRQAAVTPPSGTQNTTAKSTAWTSDAYGYTIVANGRTQTFRDQRQAEAAIRALPDGSISRITLYGHGAPGGQSVGDAYYEAGDTAALLKGKMAPGGTLQYSGCNTASIGGATLNPAVGLSMLTRRILYFSVPYIQDRLDGRPAAESRQQWEKTWNADLSRDTSLQLRGTTVCGYRTFGLVPGRLPVFTHFAGNQEATTPGYVAGKLACYRDGREVPAP